MKHARAEALIERVAEAIRASCNGEYSDMPKYREMAKAAIWEMTRMVAEQ